MQSVFRSRKGVFFFVIDVVIGIMIFFITIVLITSFSTSKPSLDASEKAIERVSTSLFEKSVTYVDNEKTTALKENNAIPSLDMTVNQLAVYFYLENNQSESRQLIANTTSWATGQIGFSYHINETLIYNKSASVKTQENSDVRLSRKKITLLNGEENVRYEPVVVEVRVWQ
ncbi:MAG: hypothetical protein ACOCZV_00575 [Nanoarchaeota archaeon]